MSYITDFIFCWQADNNNKCLTSKLTFFNLSHKLKNKGLAGTQQGNSGTVLWAWRYQYQPFSEVSLQILDLRSWTHDARFIWHHQLVTVCHTLQFMTGYLKSMFPSVSPIQAWKHQPVSKYYHITFRKCNCNNNNKKKCQHDTKSNVCNSLHDFCCTECTCDNSFTKLTCGGLETLHSKVRPSAIVSKQ